MDGVANLTDVMLVFACGLMVALIYFFNVDIQNTSSYTDVELGDELEDIAGAASDDDGSGDFSEFEEIGKVYQGPDGKLYMVEGSAADDAE